MSIPSLPLLVCLSPNQPHLPLTPDKNEQKQEEMHLKWGATAKVNRRGPRPALNSLSSPAIALSLARSLPLLHKKTHKPGGKKRGTRPGGGGEAAFTDFHPLLRPHATAAYPTLPPPPTFPHLHITPPLPHEPRRELEGVGAERAEALHHLFRHAPPELRLGVLYLWVWVCFLVVDWVFNDGGGKTDGVRATPTRQRATNALTDGRMHG